MVGSEPARCARGHLLGDHLLDACCKLRARLALALGLRLEIVHVHHDGPRGLEWG